MKLICYEAVPNDYGQVRFFPLALANETNTLLEEWFINFKYLHFCTTRVDEKDFADFHLPVEYHYSRRVRSRSFEQIERDVRLLMDQSLFQELFRILVITLEKANELYEIASTKKQGNSVFDLKEHVEQKNRAFHKQSFPNKIEKFKVQTQFVPFLGALQAVNKARNCLEHRYGVVAKQDCNEGNKLVIKFRFPASVSAEGKPRGILERAPTNTRVDFRIVEGVKKFRVGDRVEMTFDDSYKLIYTINFALKGIIDHIYDTCGVTEQEPILKQFKP